MAINQIKVANEPKQDIAINKADQIINQLTNDVVHGETVKSVQNGLVNIDYNDPERYDDRTLIPDVKLVSLATIDINKSIIEKFDVIENFMTNFIHFVGVKYNSSSHDIVPICLKNDGIYADFSLFRQGVYSPNSTSIFNINIEATILDFEVIEFY